MRRLWRWTKNFLMVMGIVCVFLTFTECHSRIQGESRLPTDAEIEAHLQGHSSGGPHLHTPEGLEAIRAYQVRKVREGNERWLREYRARLTREAQEAHDRIVRLEASRPILQTTIVRELRGGAGAVQYEVTLPDDAPCSPDRLYAEDRAAGKSGWSRYGGPLGKAPVRVTYTRLRWGASHEFSVLVECADGEVRSEVLKVKLENSAANAADRAKLAREKAAQEAREAHQAKLRQEAQEAERKQRAIEEERRKQRERDATAHAKRMAEVEEAERQRLAKVALGERQRALLAKSSLHLRYINSPRSGLLRIGLSEPADSAGAFETVHVEVSPAGEGRWSMPSRRSHPKRNPLRKASWDRGELPARETLRLGVGKWDLRLMGWSRYGRIHSNILTVESRRKPYRVRKVR